MYCGIVTTKRWEWLTQITPRPKEYYFGVTPGRGEVVLRTKHELRDYIEDGILTSDMLSVEIKNNDETVVKRNVADAEYDSYTKELTLELEDTLASWGRRQYPGRGLTEETSAFALLTEVFSGLGYTESDVEKMCVNKIVVGTEGDEMTVAEFLKAIMIPYPYLEPDTYRATIEKFCRLAMLCCYADDNNFPVFVSGRPVMTQEEKDSPIPDIPKSHQFGSVKKTVIKKNKAKKVEVEVLDIKEEFGNIGESIVINYIEKQEKTLETAESIIYVYNDEDKNEYAGSTTLVDYGNSSFIAYITKDIKVNYDTLMKTSDFDKLKLKYNIKYSNPRSQGDSIYPISESMGTRVPYSDTPNTTQIITYNNLNITDRKLSFEFCGHSTRTNNPYGMKLLNVSLQWKGILRKTEKRTILFPSKS